MSSGTSAKCGALIKLTIGRDGGSGRFGALTALGACLLGVGGGTTSSVIIGAWGSSGGGGEIMTVSARTSMGSGDSGG